MSFKRIAIILIALLLLGIAIGYFLYQNPTELVSSGKPALTTTTAELEQKGTVESDTQFNRQLVGKLVQLKGIVASKSILDAGNTLFFKTENENIVITAAFDKSLTESVEAVNLGTETEVLCMCNGIAKPEDEEDLLSETTITFNRCSFLEK
jgi:hypothetical protein